MKENLISLIQSEDPKNPYTDSIIAEVLHVRRDRVTLLRKEIGIPDSRERRKEILAADIGRIIRERPDITNTELTSVLQGMGYQLSRFVVGQIREQLLDAGRDPAQSGRASQPAAADKAAVSPVMRAYTIHVQNIYEQAGAAFEKVIG